MHSVKRLIVFPVETDEIKRSTCFPQILHWVLSLKIIWLLAFNSGVNTKISDPLFIPFSERTCAKKAPKISVPSRQTIVSICVLENMLARTFAPLFAILCCVLICVMSIQ